MANDLMKPNTSAETPAERNARILAQVARLKSETPEAVYTPYEGGVNYVSFNGNDGEFTFGLNKNSIPAGQRFIVPMESVKHGCLEWESKKKIHLTNLLLALNLIC